MMHFSIKSHKAAPIVFDALVIIARNETNRRFNELNPEKDLILWTASSFLLAMTRSDPN